MRSPISSSALHSAILASLALGAASGVSLGQAFNVAPAHPSGPDTVTTVTGTPSLGGAPFFRISNLNGVVAAPSYSTDLATVAAATTGGTANTDNYLNRIGQFSFARDNPILNVKLTLQVDSVYDQNLMVVGDRIGGVDGSFNRSAFLMHDFGLLFVGNGGARFAMSRISDSFVGRFSADENFAVVEPLGGGFSIEYVPVPNLDPDTGELIPLANQIRSLEWLDSTPLPDDGSWDPNTGGIYDDTFPVTADAAASPSFCMVRGVDAGADPLYVSGGNNTVWNVYLFSTGPIETNVQLNLSQIQVTLAVPEASDALAAGMGLILVAGVIRSRMRA